MIVVVNHLCQRGYFLENKETAVLKIFPILSTIIQGVAMLLCFSVQLMDVDSFVYLSLTEVVRFGV